MDEPFFCEVFISFTTEDFVFHASNVSKNEEKTKIFLILNFPLELIHCHYLSLVTMYTLAIILFTIPLFFSHIFARVGIVFWSSSFERVKVYLFLILVAVALCELVLFYSERLAKYMLKQYVLFFLFLLFPLFSFFIFSGESFWLWSQEKHHGYIWYLGLTLFAGIVSLSTDLERRRMIIASLIASSLVALFALLEYIGISLPSSGTGRVTWELGRTISTLGNPNYVAGYLLMHIPLIMYIRSPERYILAGIIILAMITTGSYIGIVLMLGYFLYRITLRFSYGKYIFPLLIILWWVTVYLVAPTEKLLSFISRWVLMLDVIKNFFTHPIALLTWYGPDSIITLYSSVRSSVINMYFPPTSAIDSSHNILLDTIYSYGIISFGYILWTIRNRWSERENQDKIAIILGILFFSLNVIVLAPLILLITLIYASNPSGKK